MGERVPAGALSGSRVQHEGRSGASFESAVAAASRRTGRKPRLSGQAQWSASTGPSGRIGTRSANPEFRAGRADAVGRG